MTSRFLLTSIFVVAAVSSFAQKKELRCPVTKLTIPNKSAAVGKSAFKGKTYYFCTGHCKSLFDKNPKKFAK